MIELLIGQYVTYFTSLARRISENISYHKLFRIMRLPSSAILAFKLMFSDRYYSISQKTYLKTFENISKCKDLEKEISRIWNFKTTLRVYIEALEIISNVSNKYVDQISDSPELCELKKIINMGTSHVLSRLLSMQWPQLYIFSLWLHDTTSLHFLIQKYLLSLVGNSYYTNQKRNTITIIIMWNKVVNYEAQTFISQWINILPTKEGTKKRT